MLLPYSGSSNEVFKKWSFFWPMETVGDMMLVKNLTSLLYWKPMSANRMALSVSELDIWKVLFQLFPCFIHSAVITIVVETFGDMMLVKNLTSLLYWKPMSANRMVLSVSELDIWKVLFQLFPCFIHSAVITIVVENALSDIKTDIWKVSKSFLFLFIPLPSP